MTTSTTSDIRAWADGRSGRVTLARPRALNALTLPMIRALDQALDTFERDSAVMHVVLDGEGGRAFCAGGDIVALRAAALSGDHAPAEMFWREEYRLNARIARFPKPVVAIMDGIVMGGGVGLAGHASYRMTTERLTLGMPEVGIGFAPDVGATWLLSQTEGELGTHMALTGALIGADDALAMGLADLRISSDRIQDLLRALRTHDLGEAFASVDAGIGGTSSPLLEARDWIDEAYAGDDPVTMVARLRARPEPAAHEAADAIESASPTAIHIALRALRNAAELPDLETCLKHEYRIATSFLDVSDFAEGIRAAVVDKDRRPRWSPGNLDAVDPRAVDRAFASRADDELELPR